jgi:hypothetical protein
MSDVISSSSSPPPSPPAVAAVADTAERPNKRAKTHADATHDGAFGARARFENGHVASLYFPSAATMLAYVGVCNAVSAASVHFRVPQITAISSSSSGDDDDEFFVHVKPFELRPCDLTDVAYDFIATSNRTLVLFAEWVARLRVLLGEFAYAPLSDDALLDVVARMLADIGTDDPRAAAVPRPPHSLDVEWLCALAATPERRVHEALFGVASQSTCAPIDTDWLRSVDHGVGGGAAGEEAVDEEPVFWVRRPKTYAAAAAAVGAQSNGGGARPCYDFAPTTYGIGAPEYERYVFETVTTVTDHAPVYMRDDLFGDTTFRNAACVVYDRYVYGARAVVVRHPKPSALHRVYVLRVAFQPNGDAANTVYYDGYVSSVVCAPRHSTLAMNVRYAATATPSSRIFTVIEAHGRRLCMVAARTYQTKTAPLNASFYGGVASRLYAAAVHTSVQPFLEAAAVLFARSTDAISGAPAIFDAQHFALGWERSVVAGASAATVAAADGSTAAAAAAAAIAARATYSTVAVPCSSHNNTDGIAERISSAPVYPEDDGISERIIHDPRMYGYGAQWTSALLARPFVDTGFVDLCGNTEYVAAWRAGYAAPEHVAPRLCALDVDAAPVDLPLLTPVSRAEALWNVGILVANVYAALAGRAPLTTHRVLELGATRAVLEYAGNAPDVVAWVLVATLQPDATRRRWRYGEMPSFTESMVARLGWSTRERAWSMPHWMSSAFVVDPATAALRTDTVAAWTYERNRYRVFGADGTASAHSPTSAPITHYRRFARPAAYEKRVDIDEAYSAWAQRLVDLRKVAQVEEAMSVLLGNGKAWHTQIKLVLPTNQSASHFLAPIFECLEAHGARFLLKPDLLITYVHIDAADGERHTLSENTVGNGVEFWTRTMQALVDTGYLDETDAGTLVPVCRPSRCATDDGKHNEHGHRYVGTLLAYAATNQLRHPALRVAPWVMHTALASANTLGTDAHSWPFRVYPSVLRVALRNRFVWATTTHSPQMARHMCSAVLEASTYDEFKRRWRAAVADFADVFAADDAPPLEAGAPHNTEWCLTEFVRGFCAKPSLITAMTRAFTVDEVLANIGIVDHTSTRHIDVDALLDARCTGAVVVDRNPGVIIVDGVNDDDDDDDDTETAAKYAAYAECLRSGVHPRCTLCLLSRWVRRQSQQRLRALLQAVTAYPYANTRYATFRVALLTSPPARTLPSTWTCHRVLKLADYSRVTAADCERCTGVAGASLETLFDQHMSALLGATTIDQQ